MSTLTHTHSADLLGIAICDMIKKYQPKTILEIGSSDGTGSTTVIAEATNAKIYCIESDKDRFIDLIDNTKKYDNVTCFNVPSVGVYGMIPKEYLKGFYFKYPKYNLWKWIGMKEMMKWWDNTLAMIKASDIPDGINHIKESEGIECFDMALIDGGPFTGLEEVKQVLGAKVIILDDVMDLKCRDAYDFLSLHYNLELENMDYRNGFAVFVKR